MDVIYTGQLINLKEEEEGEEEEEEEEGKEEEEEGGGADYYGLLPNIIQICHSSSSSSSPSTYLTIPNKASIWSDHLEGDHASLLCLIYEPLLVVEETHWTAIAVSHGSHLVVCILGKVECVVTDGSRTETKTLQSLKPMPQSKDVQEWDCTIFKPAEEEEEERKEGEKYTVGRWVRREVGREGRRGREGGREGGQEREEKHTPYLS